MRLDDADRRLLRQLLAAPEASTADLATRANMTEATCWRRLTRLRSAGILRGRQAVIDWRKLGWQVEVSLRVTLDKTQPRAFDDFTDAARRVPEILEIQTFLGRVDVRLHVIARDMIHYRQIYRDHILSLPRIADLEALMHLSDIKSDESLPI